MIGLFVKEGVIVWRMIKESISFAISSLLSEKLRTSLSLSGITIGIFSIVAPAAVIDSLRKDVVESFGSFGSEVLYIGRYPLSPDEAGNDEESSSLYPWWEYLSRPAVTKEEFRYISDNALYSTPVYTWSGSSEVASEHKRRDDATLLQISGEGEKILTAPIISGRFFSGIESSGRAACAILGSNISSLLFGQNDPIGEKIRIKGREMEVIGLLGDQGDDLFSMLKTDDAVLIPEGIDLSDMRGEGMIAVIPHKGISPENVRSELRLLMRSHRRLRPEMKDDFSINEMTYIKGVVEDLFTRIGWIGGIIGGFSLLIGAFGIANIMFVSVRQRSFEIGVCKAIGAKRYAIMTQYLSEAAILSLLGGLAGIALSWSVIGLTAIISENIRFSITLENITGGVLISIITGIAAGALPAGHATSIDPVKAIRRL